VDHFKVVLVCKHRDRDEPDHPPAISEVEMHLATKAWRAGIRGKRLAKRVAKDVDVPDGDDAASWKDQLTARVLELPPAGFERLAQRVLREAGFVNVTVTGRMTMASLGSGSSTHPS
jgi:hypothetical protein